MINVNKLFRRLSIRVKLVIAFVLLGVIPLLVVGGYGAFYSFSVLSERLLDQVKFGVTTKAGDIQSFLSNVKEDVLFLSRLPTFRQLTDLLDTANAARQSLVDRLGGEFLAFSQAHKAYYQVRYIDQRGMEVVRTDFDGKQSYLIPRDQLQNKADRYYFREAIQISPGEVYVSPMDLNIEKGLVEVPHRPVVRYATPVINSRGVRKGIVIINIYASYVLGQVLALRRDEGGIVFLADKRGFYLSHSDRSKANGGYFSLTAADNLKNDFPQLMAGEILSGKPGTLVGPGASGKIVAFAPIYPYPGNQKGFWVIAQAYNKAEVLSSIRSFQFLILILGSLVLAIAVTAGFAAAGHFTKPILELSRGAEIVAGGNFDYRIKVETNDEIEELAYRFNVMTQKLKEHEEQLRTAHERLEIKAREAEALYRIGTEISAFLEVDKILYLVVEKAHELLGGDAAVLCLLDQNGQGLIVGATSGPAEAFSFERGRSILGLPESIGDCASSKKENGGPKDSAFACRVISGDYLKAHLAVPLKTRDKVIGALCVGNRASREFLQKDVDLLSGLASQAAIAIENARLHRQVRSLAALAERERISKDLHDGIIQSIYATGLALEDGIQLVDEDRAKAKERLEQAIEDLNEVIKDVRNYIFNLQPGVLHGKDFQQALADLVKGLKINSLVDAELVIGDGIEGMLSQEQKTHLLHIAREALANVAKHARASRARVELSHVADVLILSIEDNGVGLNSESARTGGLGLTNIAERARLLGGGLEIESGVGRGTRLVVKIRPGDSEDSRT